MRDFKVTEKAKLLEYLFQVLSDTKKSNVKQFLKTASVLVNGKPTTQFDFPLSPGDKVSIKSARDPRSVPEPEHDLKIIFQDDAIVVINKPAGLLSVGTEKEPTKTAIFTTNEYLHALEAERLRQLGKRDNQETFRDKQIFIVHRLDKGASGLMIFAKSEEVKQKLQADWDQVTKRYYAVVEGIPPQRNATVESFLFESVALKVYSSHDEEGGKRAVTHYQVLRSSSHYSILEVKIDTGRKHQIRVHLSDSGHPIAGDDRYNARTNPARRLALHACYLALKHPVTGKEIVFHSPLPKSFDQILNKDRLIR